MRPPWACCLAADRPVPARPCLPPDPAQQPRCHWCTRRGTVPWWGAEQQIGIKLP